MYKMGIDALSDMLAYLFRFITIIKQKIFRNYCFENIKKI